MKKSIIVWVLLVVFWLLLIVSFGDFRGVCKHCSCCEEKGFSSEGVNALSVDLGKIIYCDITDIDRREVIIVDVDNDCAVPVGGEAIEFGVQIKQGGLE